MMLRPACGDYRLLRDSWQVLVVTRDGWLSLFMAAVIRAGYQSAAAALHCDAPRTAIAGGKTVLAASRHEPNPGAAGAIIPVAGSSARVTVRSNSDESAFGNITSINDGRCGRANRSGPPPVG